MGSHLVFVLSWGISCSARAPAPPNTSAGTPPHQVTETGYILHHSLTRTSSLPPPPPVSLAHVSNWLRGLHANQLRKPVV